MRGCLKKTRTLQTVAFIICLLFLAPGLLFADEKADAAEIAARKDALNEFFSNTLCLDCHGATPKYNLKWAQFGYDESVHKNGGNSFYANGGGCQRCHTHEGFVEYVATGTVDTKAYVRGPSQVGCFTCHDSHKTGDLSLTTTAPVTLSNGKIFDKGKGNLCANCHQTRLKTAELIKVLPAKKVSGHWGPHHGPEADMLIGNNAYEYPGKTYYSSVHSTLAKNGCIECHMGYPEKRFSFAPDMSGHSFNIVGEVHHQPKLNTSGCLGNCHAKMKQVKILNPDTPLDTFWWHQTEAIFSTEAKADFDSDGKVEPLQAEIEGVLNLFVNKKGTGYLQRGKLPMYKRDGKWNWTKSDMERPLREMAALYNYKFVLEDRSRGIHNAPYSIQILYDSIETLDPGFDTSKRNVYRPPEEYKPPEKKAPKKK